jgi:hypothetical protein
MASCVCGGRLVLGREAVGNLALWTWDLPGVINRGEFESLRVRQRWLWRVLWVALAGFAVACFFVLGRFGPMWLACCWGCCWRSGALRFYGGGTAGAGFGDSLSLPPAISSGGRSGMRVA